MHASTANWNNIIAGLTKLQGGGGLPGQKQTNAVNERLKSTEQKLFDVLKQHQQQIATKEAVIQDLQAQCSTYRTRIENLTAQLHDSTLERTRLTHVVEDLQEQLRIANS